MRQRTVFDWCEVHSNLGGGRRAAEIVCEGGPGSGAGCSPRLCRVLPGTDYYSPTTDEEFVKLVQEWAVNRDRSAQP
jgi:hypothetical protein